VSTEQEFYQRVLRKEAAQSKEIEAAVILADGDCVRCHLDWDSSCLNRWELFEEVKVCDGCQAELNALDP
jgi:hypothetical protein